MDSLLQEPFSLVQGDSIVVNVTASNVLGDGPSSVLSSSVIAYVETTPHKPTA
jgi:hypothetical protein